MSVFLEAAPAFVEDEVKDDVFDDGGSEEDDVDE